MIRLVAATLMLAGCGHVAARPEPPYRAIGTEPFWDLTVDARLVFTDRGRETSVSEPAPRPVVSAAGRTYRGRRLVVSIARGPCSDGMSDRSYPDTVTVSVDGQSYRGCGADAYFYRRGAP